MITVRLIEDGRAEDLSSYPTLQEALDDVRAHWSEDDGKGTPVFLFDDDKRGTQAIMVRHQLDPEVAITTFTGGVTTSHRCRYVYSEVGDYQRTDVTFISCDRT
jgi:hypothetical protein